MTDLGDMKITFTADLSKLTPGISDAKGQISGVAEVAEKTSGLFLGALGKMGGGILGFTSGALSTLAGGVISHFGAIKDQFMSIADESISAQAGMKQTEEAIRSTGDASGMTANQIADMAGNLSHLTKFSDDTVQSGENMLLTFTGIGKDVFPQATKTMLDLSQAMGQDVKSSAIQLGKALNDPLTGMSALQRVGVSFDETEQKQIKTMMAHNNIVGAQTVMLKELQKEFGGSAEAAGKTFGGQLVILGQYLDDVRQTIGDKLLPVLTDFIGFVTNTALPGIEDFGAKAITYLGNIFKSLNFTDFKQAWQAIGVEIGSITNQFKGLGDVIGTDADPLAEFIGTLMHAGLDTITNILYDISSGFMAIDKALQDGSLAKMLGDVFDIIGQAHGFIETIEGDLVKFGAGLLDAAFKSGALQSVLHTVKDLLPTVGEFVKGLGSDLDTNLLPPLKGLIENVGTTIKNFSDWLDKSGALKDSLNFLGGVVDKTTGLVGGLVGYVSSLVNWFNQGGPDVDAFKDAILLVANALIAVQLVQFTNNLIGLIGQVKESVTNFIKLADTVSMKAVEAFKLFRDGATVDLAEVSAAEEKVGVTAETTMAEGIATGTAESEASLKGLGAQAVETEGQLAQVGMQAGETQGKVATASSGMEGEIAGIGAAGLAAGGLLLGGLIAAGVYLNTLLGQWASDAGTWSANWILTWAGVDTKTSASAADMQKKVTASANQMKTNVDDAFSKMQVDTYNKTYGFTQDAIRMLQGMGKEGDTIMQSLDKSTQYYWNDIAATINNMSAQAANDANANFARIHHIGPGIFNKNFNDSSDTGGYASGGTDIPGGWYDVGERGPETMYVPDGSTIYPYGTVPYVPSSGATGGGDIHVHVDVHVDNHNEIDGRKMTDVIMTHAMKEIRRNGVRAA